MRLGAKVLKLLEDRNIDRAELAAFLGTKPSTVSGWAQENRNPSAMYIIPICEFLHITPNELFDVKEEEAPSGASTQITSDYIIDRLERLSPAALQKFFELLDVLLTDQNPKE